MSPTNNAIRAKNNEQPDSKEHLRILGPYRSPEQVNLESLEKETRDRLKIDTIAWHFGEIMKTLELDLTDDSLQNTPQRVAKMYVREVFQGLDPDNKPDVTLFENKYNYDQMLVERDIKVHSFCEHHFVPILGKAHVAYISSGKVIGLSKINRIVNYFARRPQVQERLTGQIAEELKKVLETEDVAVLIEADHMCVVMRGVQDQNSNTTTSSYHGRFLDREFRDDFLTHVYRSHK